MMGSVWSGIKAVLGITSSSGAENVMRVASGVGSWIDEQQWTKEEKHEWTLKITEQYASYLALTADENTERSRTRRSIALWIIRWEVLILVASIVLYKLDQPLAEYAYKVATESPLGLLTLGVGAFFFGTHLVRSVK